eukprot:840866-Rhodomonas_salina.1
MFQRETEEAESRGTGSGKGERRGKQPCEGSPFPFPPPCALLDAPRNPRQGPNFSVHFAPGMWSLVLDRLLPCWARSSISLFRFEAVSIPLRRCVVLKQRMAVPLCAALRWRMGAGEGE